MKNFFQRLFRKKSSLDKQSEVKQFSNTLTTATDGSDAKHKLNPEVSALVSQLKQGKQINHSQLNQLASFYFNIAPIENSYYKFNSSIQQGMAFGIDGVDTVTNDVGDIVTIKLSMKELVYNIDLTIKISVEDFHEFLLPVPHNFK